MNRPLALLLAGVGLLAANAAQAAGPRTAMEVSGSTAQPVTDPVQMAAWLRRVVGKYEFEGMVEVVYDHDGEGYDEHRCAPLPPDPEKNNPDTASPGASVPYCSPIQGKGDCAGIGTGPGVQCILNVAWQDFREFIPPPDPKDLFLDCESIRDFEKRQQCRIQLERARRPGTSGDFELPGGTSNLAPAMILFGLDPLASRLQYLLVDQKGLPEGGPGLIKGDRATFTATCVNAPALFAAMKPPPHAPAPTRPEGTPLTCERVIRIDAKPDASVVHWSMDISINDELWTRYEMTLRRKF